NTVSYYISVASFYVENFGCRATQADGAAIERQFRNRGLERSALPSQAEIVVLNTCTVTASADQDARAAIRRIHRDNPACQIVVTGCYAQRAPEELAALPGVSRVIGNSHKHQLVDISVPTSVSTSTPSSTARDFVPLTSLMPESPSQIYVSDIFAHTELFAAPVFDAAERFSVGRASVGRSCVGRAPSPAKSRIAPSHFPLRGSRRCHPGRDHTGKAPHQLGRTHGLERRPDSPDRRISTYRQARACSHAVRQRQRSAPHAPQV